MELRFDIERNDLLEVSLQAFRTPLSALSSVLVVNKEQENTCAHSIGCRECLSVAPLKTRAITAAKKYFCNQTMAAVLNSLNALVV